MSAAASPTARARRLLLIVSASAPAAAAETSRPTVAADRSSGWLPPSAARSANASDGMPKIINWFQTVATVTAVVIAREEKPHAFNIANDSPIPTAGPPGATYVEAVDASELASAAR